MEEYKKLVNNVHAFLGKEWTKSGFCFYVHRMSNWGIIEFQKSRSSTSTEIVFTINLGVCSSAVRQFTNEGDLSKKPEIDDCHWKERIGFLTHKKEDKWWTICKSTDLTELSREIINILDSAALPEINNWLLDQALINNWINGISSGITEYQRFVFLTVLLKKNRDARLSSVVSDYMASTNGRYNKSVELHLQELNSTYHD